MSPVRHSPLTLSEGEIAIIVELLESARTRLLVEIRHTDHRAYRDELRARMDAIENLLERCRE